VLRSSVSNHGSNLKEQEAQLMRTSTRTLGLVLFLSAARLSAQDPHEADHQALREMLVTVTDAINTQKVEKMEPLMAEHFSIVLADNELFTSIAGLKAYYAKLMTPPEGVIKSLTLKPSADGLTQFITADVGVCHGTSEDTFVMVNGETRVLKSRWTTTFVKRDGAWKIAAIQAGSNILDNPILDAHKSVAKASVVGAVVASVLLGLTGFALGRRSARS
jgi:hypothetical protein